MTQPGYDPNLSNVDSILAELTGAAQQQPPAGYPQQPLPGNPQGWPQQPPAPPAGYGPPPAPPAGYGPPPAPPAGYGPPPAPPAGYGPPPAPPAGYGPPPAPPAGYGPPPAPPAGYGPPPAPPATPAGYPMPPGMSEQLPPVNPPGETARTKRARKPKDPPAQGSVQMPGTNVVQINGKSFAVTVHFEAID